MLLVRKPGRPLDKDEVLAYLAERVAKWWLPDEVIFLDGLPLGATGKVQKSDLRRQYGGVLLDAAA
ncbi:long-chain-fatty-acid--CoA ligase [compost metagenome]